MTPPFDPSTERRFVEHVLVGRQGYAEQFDRRLACVPRMLAHRNRTMGGPLNQDELLDVVQDTFVVILRQLPSYRPIRPLESWIYGICSIQMRHALRLKRRYEGRNSAMAGDTVDPRARAVVDQVTDYADALAALEQLGGIEADILQLKHLEGLTFEEVGRRLNLPTNTAKTHYYRGLARLRRHIGTRAGRDVRPKEPR